MKTKLYMSIMGLFSIILTFSQVGINTTTPHESSVLQLNSNDRGFLLPYFDIPDLNAKAPVTATTVAEGIMAYNTNSTTGKGIYYWDGIKWTGLGQVNFTNIYNSVIKPLNGYLADLDTYPYPTTPLVAPSSPQVAKFVCDYTAPGDRLIINNPLAGAPHNFVIWDNVNQRINIPQQLLGYTISISISLSYPQVTANAGAVRFVAYSGNTVVNTADGTFSGGVLIKDLIFKQTKTSSLITVRDEISLSPIIINQQLIDEGIVLYLGSGDNSPLSFYNPRLFINLGLVNITL